MEERTDERIADIIQAELWELRDEGYRDFHAKLIPTVAREKIIGVGTPPGRPRGKKMGDDPPGGGVRGPRPPQDE